MAIILVIFAVFLAVWLGLFNDIIKRRQKITKARKAWIDKES